MEVVAKSSYERISPRKLRLVADVVRNFSLRQALTFLENSPKAASLPLLKTVKQAIGNATNNLGLDRQTLKLKKIEIGEGPTHKRWRAVSRGRAHKIEKKTSHISVVLEGEKVGIGGKRVAKGKTTIVKEEGKVSQARKEKNGTKN